MAVIREFCFQVIGNGERSFTSCVLLYDLSIFISPSSSVLHHEDYLTIHNKVNVFRRILRCLFTCCM